MQRGLLTIRRTLFLLAVAVIVVSLLPGSVSQAAVRAKPPYACGFCVFELPLAGGRMRIVWGNPQLSSFDDLSPAQGQVLFTRVDRGVGEGLYVAKLDGSGAQRIATGSNARWSPDGTKIAYLRPRPPSPSAPCAGAALAVVNADGTDDRLIDGGCSRDPAWSADSKHLAYFAIGSGYEVARLAIVGADGSGLRTLAPLRATPIPSGLGWSPRGDRLSFTAFADAQPPSGHGVSGGGPRDYPTSNVEVLGTDGNRRALLARASDAVWKPGGDGFAFEHSDKAVAIGYENAEASQSLRFASAEGKTLRVLRRDCCGLVHWLPDGRLAYLAEGPSPKRGESIQIYLARGDGSQPRQLTHLLPGGVIDNYWFAPDRSRVFFVWEFTDVD